MLDLTRIFWLSWFVDSSVGAVLVSDALSMELSVDVMLCFDGERRMVLIGRDGLELGLRDLTELWELDPAQSLPRNREAAACICGKETPVGTPWDWL